MHDARAPRHPIRVVCRRTGLKPDVIRAWERRYGAVAPARTETDRRLYSDEDIERLVLLRRAVLAGRNISQVATLERGALERLVAEDLGGALPPPASLVTAWRASSSEPRVARGEAPATEPTVPRHLERSLEAIDRLDAGALMRQFELAAHDLSRRQLLEDLIVPLMHELGRLWQSAALSPAHEHLSTSVVRTYLGSLTDAFRPSLNAPRLIVTTPANQWHELGALIAGTTAASEGWAVTYLGANLPAVDIALAARRIEAKAIALSLTYPEDDSGLPAELRRLRVLIGGDVALLVGGRAVDAYRDALDEVQAQRIGDLDQLRRELAGLA
jgi:DNA-binding transcriptional MerR regulator/methylmalonyl-CoA mutase cobalamin-binding subunit